MSILSVSLRKIAAEIVRLADLVEHDIGEDCTIGVVKYCRANASLRKAGVVTRLTRSESVILGALVDNAGVLVSRDDLTALLFGSRDVVSRTIDQHVLNLRRKLGNDTIETVNGIGYRLAVEVRP